MILNEEIVGEESSHVHVNRSDRMKVEHPFANTRSCSERVVERERKKRERKKERVHAKVILSMGSNHATKALLLRRGKRQRVLRFETDVHVKIRKRAREREKETERVPRFDASRSSFEQPSLRQDAG